MDLSQILLDEKDLSRVQAHALNLMQEGSWCSPTCIAHCGNLILTNSESKSNSSQEIVSCFKDKCDCKRPSVSQQVDPELFQKYEQNMRVEHLLLEKEVSDIMNRLQTNYSADRSMPLT